MLPKDYLSVSQINTWLQCPAKYDYRYRQQIPEPTKPAPMILGSIVHSAIARFHAMEFLKKPYDPKAHLVEALDRETNTVDYSLINEPHNSRDGVLALGEQLVTQYVDLFPWQSESVLTTEEKFFVETSTKSVPILGYLDVVLVHRETPVIREIKTRRRKTNSTQLSRDIQVAVYQYAYERQFHVLPKLQYVELIYTKTKTYTQVLETDQRIASVQWVEALIAQVADSIISGVSPSKPGWQCDGCAYGSRCMHNHPNITWSAQVFDAGPLAPKAKGAQP